jgi:hypothetical protein
VPRSRMAKGNLPIVQTTSVGSFGSRSRARHGPEMRNLTARTCRRYTNLRLAPRCRRCGHRMAAIADDEWEQGTPAVVPQEVV